MSNIAVKGADTGTGVFTIESPATNTDRVLTLPDVGGGEFIVSDASGKVGIGTSSPARPLHVDSGSTVNTSARFDASGRTNSYITFVDQNTTNELYVRLGSEGNSMVFDAGNAERMRIDSSGNLLVSKTSSNVATAGGEIGDSGTASFTRSNGAVLNLNRLSNDGTIVSIFQNTVGEGSISVSGTTVSYNGGHLSRWSRLPDGADDTNIYKGTVMTNLNEKIVWDGEDNEQLNYTNVSLLEGDKNVAGIFVAWDESDEWGDYYLAQTGDLIIRIAQGVTVERGDLLMSAGDGTAKPQTDDLVRSSTIAKVISTEVTYTYPDGSYAIPCVVMGC